MTAGGRESADPLTIRVVLGSLAIVAILLVAIVILRAKLDHLERGLYAERPSPQRLAGVPHAR